MPDIRGSIKPILSKNKMNATVKNTSSTPSFFPEEAFLLPEDKPLSSPVISSATSPRVPSAMPPQNVIRNAGIQVLPEEPSDDSSNFLGSLIAQGITGIGTGLMGGDSYDIMRSANVFQNMRDRQANEKRAKLLTDPKSEESKKRRMVFKNLGYDVPEDLSYTDLNDSNVLQGLRSKQMEQPKLAGMTRGGGVGQVKPEKEVKSDKKILEEYSKHTEVLQSSLDTLESINKLNRSRLGRYFPDSNISSQVEAGEIDRQAVPQVKVLAGPGTLSDSDFDRLSPLVANSNMSKELASETVKRNLISGTKKALAKLQSDRDVGLINNNDYNKLINQYNKYLSNPKLELNKKINIDTGQIEDIETDFNSL